MNGLRNLILDALFTSPVVTAKEWATAVERTSNTESLATLAKWYQNTVAELGRREAAAPAPAPAAAPAAPAAAATKEQKQEIVKLLNHPTTTRARKVKELARLGNLTQPEALALLADLTARTAPTPPRPVGGGLTVNRRGQLAVAALASYAGGVSVSYVQAA